MSIESFSFLRVLRYIHNFFGRTFFICTLIIIISSFWVTIFTVNGRSMEPTFYTGEYIGVNLLGYIFSTPQKGDLVVVQFSTNQQVRLVKRVQGVPGDMVLVQGKPVLLQADQYYIEGDNRDQSTDSRVFGPINKNQIIGKVMVL